MPLDSRADASARSIAIGLDIGSTTVKAVVVDPESREVLWHGYERHHTRQPEKALDFLQRIEAAFGPGSEHDLPLASMRLFLTGSGAGPLIEPTGGRFVQEVNAVTTASLELHPDVQAVVELGGQDAKIVVAKRDEKTGQRQVFTSMNDKCASGTGATIDKCVLKTGVPAAEAAKIRFDPSTLHHVAAKCGVFAETDIVNLVKTGVPGPEILSSLADAIVMQNLSVLTRGHTLLPRVLLLGGPNTFLPMMVDCWRLRIAEVWKEREVEVPDRPIEELIFVPERSELYAALGAVFCGLSEPGDQGRYQGTGALAAFADGGRAAKLAASAGPPLSQNREETIQFAGLYSVPRFQPPAIPAGSTVRVALGLDGGSTSSKAVLVDRDGNLVLMTYRLSKGNPIEDMREMLGELRQQAEARGWTLDIAGFGVTGYAGPVLEGALRADAHVVETIAHMRSAVHCFGDVDVICDIGGQDIKVLFLKNGDVDSFKLSNQCSAGNGNLLGAMADQFGVAIEDYAERAFEAELSPEFSYGCAVFLDADRVNFQKEGYKADEMLAGLARVLPKNVWQYVVGVPRMAELGRTFVLQGGTQRNLAAVKAQVDYIRARVPDAVVHLHPYPGEAGAIGAAMEAFRVVEREGHSTFVGMDAAIALDYVATTNESTRCHFCPNECTRTFIDTRTPDGDIVRYISGFSCEKGTVEDQAALKKLLARRAEQKKRAPNLLSWHAEHAFRHRYKTATMPEAGSMKQATVVHTDRLGRVTRETIWRGFERSSAEAAERRSKLKVAMPRVLNVYSTAQLWRGYFEALGIPRQNVRFSEPTTEEMWLEGGRYGSIDPCFPSKVAVAHMHTLVFEEDARKHADIIFSPGITHVPSELVNVMDHAACPIVQGSPDVCKAAFTRERDWFAAKGMTFVGPALSLTEMTLFRDQMFRAFGEQLGVTRDESDFAVEQAWATQKAFEREIQDAGRQLLEHAEETDGIVVLVLSRPYHADPGLEHEVTAEIQALGYPVLSISSIPKDREWLQRFWQEDLDSGLTPDIFDINFIWPENFSANSAMKLWASLFAARHPNVAVLDLSSFKCGHDAPIYHLVERTLERSHTPMLALHDLDANKPGGSIGIRVRTFAYALERQRERLVDFRRKQRQVEATVEARRAALQAAIEAELELLAAAKLAAAEHQRPWAAPPAEVLREAAEEARGLAGRVTGAIPLGKLRMGAKSLLGKVRERVGA